MFCPQCGTETNKEANFCSHCGFRLIIGEVQLTEKNNVILNEIAQGKRVACNDGNCTGVIKADGKCGTCGKNLDWEDNDLNGKIEIANELKCPLCNSTQLTAQKKGFGLGKAAAGGLLLGGVGLLGGVLGSGKIKITCLKCGNSWEAGKS